MITTDEFNQKRHVCITLKSIRIKKKTDTVHGEGVNIKKKTLLKILVIAVLDHDSKPVAVVTLK